MSRTIIELREDDVIEVKDGVAYPSNPDDLAFLGAWEQVLEQKENGGIVPPHIKNSTLVDG